MSYQFLPETLRHEIASRFIALVKDDSVILGPDRRPTEKQEAYDRAILLDCARRVQMAGFDMTGVCPVSITHELGNGERYVVTLDSLA